MCVGGRDSPCGVMRSGGILSIYVSGHIRGTGSGIPGAENQTGIMNRTDTFRTVPSVQECNELRQTLDDIQVWRITVPMLTNAQADALDRQEAEVRHRLKYAKLMGIIKQL